MLVEGELKVKDYHVNGWAQCVMEKNFCTVYYKFKTEKLTFSNFILLLNYSLHQKNLKEI